MDTLPAARHGLQATKLSKAGATNENGSKRGKAFEH